MSNEDIPDFSLEKAVKPIKISGDDYVILELNGRDRDKYLNDLTSRLRHTKDGNTAGVKNFEGLQGFLISLALRKVNADESHTKIKLEIIQSWPARVQKEIFKLAKELSLLDGDEGDKEDEDGDQGNE